MKNKKCWIQILQEKKMLKITSKDICELVDRLVLDTIYFIEEENK